MAEPRPKDGFGNGNSNDYVTVCVSEVRKEMQCPICLGIIRKTRTVMECLHRFCRECIDKSMRLGNNECPACRTHCASRRSLRDDPSFDAVIAALIAALYPDLDKYEEEEMTLREDETRRNRQIQASIAETFKRQSEAVARRRTAAKVTAAAIVRNSHGKFRNVQNRTRGPAQRTRGANNNRGNNNGPTGYGGPLSPQEEERELPQLNTPSQKPPASNVAVPDDKAAIKEQEVIKEVSKDRAGWRKRRRSGHVEPENSEEKLRATGLAVSSPIRSDFEADFEAFVEPYLDLLSKPFLECHEASSSLARLTSEFEAYRLSAEQSVCALQAQVVEVASERDVLLSRVVELQQHFSVATEEAKEVDIARSAALLEGLYLTSQLEIVQQEVVTLKTELAENSCSLGAVKEELAAVKVVAADSMHYPGVLSLIQRRLNLLSPEERSRIGLSENIFS